ncbi:DUF4870 domain-containing protein [Flavobacterium orientale]|uniref:DUF4870 domain-containing protein n=1 Tax=Flavobacterium orientale TaxID=1756020 RepID=A0A916XVX5_9FLAO|nr:DUF4870 domain-containing protein [Flavobacterium orientale]GGD16052.1 hypothetical protein GCM10011343_03750 [Flavobacterium orientale]
MTTQNEKNTAVAIHLSSLAKYLIPFAGIIVPIIIWQSKKNESQFVDENGKSVINFNLSLLVYSIIIAIIFGIFFIDSIVELIHYEDQGIDVTPVKLITVAIITGLVLIVWSITEFILILIGTIKAGNGEVYKYPITIPFLK